MRPGVQVRRAVLCADGRQHFGPEYPEYPEHKDAAKVLAVADHHAVDAGFALDRKMYGCGGAPHYLAEQTVTTSEWQKVRP